MTRISVYGISGIKSQSDCQAPGNVRLQDLTWPQVWSRGRWHGFLQVVLGPSYDSPNMRVVIVELKSQLLKKTKNTFEISFHLSDDVLKLLLRLGF